MLKKSIKYCVTVDLIFQLFICSEVTLWHSEKLSLMALSQQYVPVYRRNSLLFPPRISWWHDITEKMNQKRKKTFPPIIMQHSFPCCFMSAQFQIIKSILFPGLCFETLSKSSQFCRNKTTHPSPPKKRHGSWWIFCKSSLAFDFVKETAKGGGDQGHGFPVERAFFWWKKWWRS